MKSLQNQLNLIKEGKGSRELFLKDAKAQFPNIVTNVLTFEEAVKALDNRGIVKMGTITEGLFGAMVGVQKPKDPDWFKIFKENVTPDKEVTKMETAGYDYKNTNNPNNMNFEEILKGYYAELRDPKNHDKSEDQLKEIVYKNLEKDPLHYVKNAQFGVKGIGYTEAKSDEPKGKKEFGMIAISTKLHEGLETSLVSMLNEATKKKKHSVDAHLNRIDKLSEVALWEKKIKMVNEMIDELNNKITMTEAEEVLDYVDKNAVKALKKEIKTLEKRKQMYEKQCSRAKAIAEKIDKKMGFAEEEDVVLDEAGDDFEEKEKVVDTMDTEEEPHIPPTDPDRDFIFKSMKRDTAPKPKNALEALHAALKNKGLKK